MGRLKREKAMRVMRWFGGCGFKSVVICHILFWFKSGGWKKGEVFF